MIECGQGVIVNLSSGWGCGVVAGGRAIAPRNGPSRGSPSLAEELPAGMAAVPLNPGIINTEMLQTCWGEGAKAIPSPTGPAAPCRCCCGWGPKHNGRPLSV